MRWSASAPGTWPGDDRWQSVWRSAVAAVSARTSLEADGSVRVEGAEAVDPRIVLVAGAHLQPGADYRIAPELTTGLVRAWVAAGRAGGLEWAPYAEAGRAHLEVHGLDRLEEVRLASTLEHLRGHGRFAPDDTAQPLSLEAETAWVRVGLEASVRRGRLEVEVVVRGLGPWWPTLAPLLLGARGAVQRELETAVSELATSLTGLATTGELVLPEPRAVDPETHRRAIRAGMGELARRQRLVADTVAALPWWRRTATRWRRELAALPALTWPAGPELVWPPTWPEVEEQLTATVLSGPVWRRTRERLETVLTETTERLLAAREDVDRYAAQPRPRTEPWLTDASLDLAWLASPTELLRGLS